MGGGTEIIMTNEDTSTNAAIIRSTSDDFMRTVLDLPLI